MLKTYGQCRQCGTCCMNGGPALHLEDLHLIQSGKISLGCLITLRKGELVIKPQQRRPQAATCELVKFKGVQQSWQCCFYNGEARSCTIYDFRPFTCRELQCWSPEAVERVVEKNVLSRFDIIGENSPLSSLVAEHEERCACPDFNKIYEVIEKGERPDFHSYENLVNEDIRLRNDVLKNHSMSVAEELFYFGRPMFQLFQQLGAVVSEVNGKLSLTT